MPLLRLGHPHRSDALPDVHFAALTGLAIVLFVLGASAQTLQPRSALLLSSPIHITGVVVDPEGKPVAAASIDHADRSFHYYKTDADGRFELDTHAPAMVVRKAGFRSGFLRTEAARELRVVLRRLNEDQKFPLCSPTARNIGIGGWGASFRFPIGSALKADTQGQDIDYGARTYRLKKQARPAAILHGSGGLWSFGLPPDSDVWKSVSYDEGVYEVAGETIVDARRQFPDGTKWRNLGRFGESAAYSGVDEPASKILDKFLDGACLQPLSKP